MSVLGSWLRVWLHPLVVFTLLVSGLTSGLLMLFATWLAQTRNLAPSSVSSYIAAVPSWPSPRARSCQSVLTSTRPMLPAGQLDRDAESDYRLFLHTSKRFYFVLLVIRFVQLRSCLGILPSVDLFLVRCLYARMIHCFLILE